MKNDLDLPLLPSAEQIRRREFATVRRGYDPDQVREYLQGVAGQVETLERELRERRKTPPSPSPGETLAGRRGRRGRSEEHTSELQSHSDLVCRLLLEKKKTSTQSIQGSQR